MAELVHDSGDAIVVAFGEAGSNGSFESGRVVCQHGSRLHDCRHVLSFA